MDREKYFNSKTSKHHIFSYLILVLATMGVPCIFYVHKDMSINHLIYFNIFLLVVSFVLIYLININQELYFHTILAKENLFSFVLVYTFSLFMASLYSYLPNMSWVYLPISILILYFSTPMIALVSTYICLFLTVFLAETSYMVQLLYMVSILCTILAFENAKTTKKYVYAGIISLSIHTALTVSYYILFLEGALKSDIYLYSILNIVINMVTMIFAIGIVDHIVIRRYTTIYSTINDQEYSLMKELKEKNEKIYYHAIHQAYFCDKIAPKLNLNSSLIRTGTYYKNIVSIKEEDIFENLVDILEHHHFPKPSIELIIELYNQREVEALSKEACLIIVTDEVIGTIERIFEKNKNIKINMDELIDAIALDLYKRKMFMNSTFTFHELEVTLQFFKEEKLYYDFLRG